MSTEKRKKALNIVREAQVLELIETLERLLWRYQNLSFIETPEWDTGDELPVRKAKKLIKKRFSKLLVKEFFLLRKLAASANDVAKQIDEKSLPPTVRKDLRDFRSQYGEYVRTRNKRNKLN